MSSYDYMDTEVLALFGAIFGIIFLAAIVGWILGIIGKWNIFTKAGKEEVHNTIESMLNLS